MASAPTVTVQSLSISPNDCALSDPLTLAMSFSLDAACPSSSWEITYLVDMTGNRQIIHLGNTATEDYAPGTHSFEFTSPPMDLSGVKKSWLNNAGLLCLTLKSSSGEDIMQVSCVTMVRKASDGTFIRNVMSPLEED